MGEMLPQRKRKVLVVYLLQFGFESDDKMEAAILVESENVSIRNYGLMDKGWTVLFLNCVINIGGNIKMVQMFDKTRCNVYLEIIVISCKLCIGIKQVTPEGVRVPVSIICCGVRLVTVEDFRRPGVVIILFNELYG